VANKGVGRSDGEELVVQNHGHISQMDNEKNLKIKDSFLGKAKTREKRPKRMG